MQKSQNCHEPDDGWEAEWNWGKLDAGCYVGKRMQNEYGRMRMDGNRQEKMQQQKRRMRKKWTCTDERGRKNRDRKLVITLEEPEETKINRVPE